MPISTSELTRAREVVGRILEELGLDAYIFEVEPDTDEWEVWIECAVAEGWSRLRLVVGRQRLLTAADSAAEQQRLMDEWKETLADCLRAR